MIGAAAKTPMEIVKEAHRKYYEAGGYSGDRYAWTVQMFLPGCKGKRILEVGCGTGKLLELLFPENEVSGVDASEDGIAACRSRGILAHCMDASSEPLPYPDEWFDAVICLETFEHMPNPYYALMEVRRVLKRDAKLICSVPNPNWGHIMLYPGLFEYKSFCQFLEQCGFQILRVEPWEWAPRETILPESLRRFRLLRSRYVAGVLRRGLALLWRGAGRFPAFCYWLWTFETVKTEMGNAPLLTRQSMQTSPKG